MALRKQGKTRLSVISADGAEQRSLAETIDVHGTAAWSPDGKWIVTGGDDAKGPGLFKIPIDGSTPVRLLASEAIDPVWSPDGSIIIYAGQAVASTRPLLAVRPDGSALSLPPIRVLSSAAIASARFRFLPNGNGLVYMQGSAVTSKDFWVLDMSTQKSRQLARLSSPATMSTFDISPDGKQIVFDRLQENALVSVLVL